MWCILLALAVISMTKSEKIPELGWERVVSDGVQSLGYKVLYADEDYNVINEVVSREEKKHALKHKERLKDQIKALPSEDVKCLMSVDRYCSKEMGQVKSILIKAVKEDCAKCTDPEKEKAGQVIASMMAHDPVAWKLFLTRTIVMLRPNKKSKKIRKKRDKEKFLPLGAPEEVEPFRHSRFIAPGAKVRVKRQILYRVSPL